MTDNAIIVSGVPRFIVNASSSWDIPGDYFLTAGSGFYNAQETNKIHDDTLNLLSLELPKCSVNFTNVIVINDSFYTTPYCPVIHMLMKWKLAYYSLIPFYHTKKYKRIFLYRPDMYTYRKNMSLHLPEFKKNTIYPIADIQEVNSRHMMGDIFIGLTMSTFAILIQLLDYFIQLQKESSYHDIHSALSSFVKEKKINIDTILGQLYSFSILRNNSTHMFDKGKLKTEYKFNDLQQAEINWNKNKNAI
jgi:hypothetical protein